MSTRTMGTRLPSSRPQKISWLWMVFSTIWAGVLVGSAITYFRMPGDGPTAPSVHIGWRLLAIGMVIVFIGVYAYTVYRMYFNRTSWLIVFDPREVLLIRGSLTTLAVSMNLLPEGKPANWQIAFVFVAIAWALTSNHERAMVSVLQAAGIALVTLIITGSYPLLGTMVYILGFGIMVAGYVMNNGLIGELVVERGRVRDQAVTEERFRLARDLHDTVGHSMTQITLKAELARRLLPDDPARAANELEDIEQLSRSLSAEVRRSIAGEVTLSLKDEIDRATELLQSMNIELNVRGDYADIQEDIADVFAWCLREGVTNVIKHSGASRCEIVFSRRDRQHILKIIDNGSNLVSENHNGQGIAGMKQRVHELSGEVDFRVTDSGHVLTISIIA